MLINEKTIDSIPVEYIDFFTALILGYNAEIAHVDNIERCVVGTREFSPSRDKDFAVRNIIPSLFKEFWVTSITYTPDFIEAKIINKDGTIAFFGYGGIESEAVCKALILKEYHEKDIEPKYRMTVH